MKFPAYTAHESARNRRGLYLADEWSAIRAQGDFATLQVEPNEANYRALLTLPEFSAKMQLARDLCQRVDFSKWATLCDLGGVPYAQTLVVSQAAPRLRIVASDFDATSNALLRNVPSLAHFKIVDCDLKSSAFLEFADCNVAMMWGVEYALSDRDFLRVLKFFAGQRADFIVCTPTAVTVWDGLRHVCRHWKSRLKGVRDRRHGWTRTLGHFARLFAKAGYSIRQNFKSGNTTFMVLTPR